MGAAGFCLWKLREGLAYFFWSRVLGSHLEVFPCKLAGL